MLTRKSLPLILIFVQVKSKRWNDAREALLSSSDCQEDDSEENALDCEKNKKPLDKILYTWYIVIS